MSDRGVVAKVLFPLIVVGALIWLATASWGGGDSTKKYTFSQTLEQVRRSPQAIKFATFHPSTQEVEFEYADGTKTTVAYPVDQSAFELQQLLESKHIIFDSKRTGSSAWWSILTSLLPFVLLFGFWIFLMQQTRQRKSGSDMSRV